MKVVVPYIHGMLREQTRTEAHRQAYFKTWPVLLCDLDAADTTAYYHLLAKLWTEADDFLIVEHDVVPPSGAFDEFTYCDGLVCSHPYVCGSRDPVIALGCTRFRKELMVEHPTVFERVGELEPDMPKRHWKRLDTRLYWVLGELTVQAHRHDPPAQHLHPYPPL